MVIGIWESDAKHGNEPCQFLFQHDLNPPENLDAALAQFWDSQRAVAIAEDKGTANWGEKADLPPPTHRKLRLRTFAEPLIRGAIEHRDAIDEQIKKYAVNWDFASHRPQWIAGFCDWQFTEMLYRDDIPPIVSINEAVDIAKNSRRRTAASSSTACSTKLKSELMRPVRIVK